MILQYKACAFTFAMLTLLWASCKAQTAVKEEDKLFHAGPVNSGFGATFFGLYKKNSYQFCDGDFMDEGCYTGDYKLSGDTIILYHLKKHKGIPTNKFLIRRYQDMDSSYWQWKYPDHKDDWKSMRYHDSAIGSTGDVFPLNSKGTIVFDRNNYFLIRFDGLKDSRQQPALYR